MISEARRLRGWVRDESPSWKSDMQKCRNEKGVMDLSRHSRVVRISDSIRGIDWASKIIPTSLCYTIFSLTRIELNFFAMMRNKVEIALFSIDSQFTWISESDKLKFVIFAASERLAMTRIRTIHGLFSCRSKFHTILIRSLTISFNLMCK